MEKELVDRAFQECGDDLGSLINRLTQLDIGSSQTDVHHLPSSSSSQQVAVPRTGSEWAELFASEITSAPNMNEAKERTTRLLGVLENSIRSNEGDAVKILEKENLMLRHKLEKATSNGIIFKQVVSKLLEGRRGMMEELESLRHKSKNLESDNYVLSMHLRQAMMTTQNKHISTNFLPDLF
ncbi:hypothetical protein MKW94_015461 [Papaver nudicaule]|uniref:Uncharacterized protein n=1 Tax=Papaver nudicaule TaxID=74823 RepID=A0AA42B259_PAPNU|nr:hypothetical protein [Papaver nudicaule]